MLVSRVTRCEYMTFSKVYFKSFKALLDAPHTDLFQNTHNMSCLCAIQILLFK